MSRRCKIKLEKKKKLTNFNHIYEYMHNKKKLNKINYNTHNNKKKKALIRFSLTKSKTSKYVLPV